MNPKKTLLFQAGTQESLFKRVALHVAFWIAWLSRTFYDIVNLYNLKGAFIFSFSYITTQLPLVYVHLYVLVPFFLNKKKYAIYIPLTILLLFAYSYLSYFVLEHIPESWLPIGLSKYISNINPNYDILEGLFALIITYSLKYTWMALSTQNKILELQKDNLQLELNALKAQVNPHFLFNTLNNIYSLSLSESKKTPEMILKLSDMMRYLLYECNAPLIRLEKEIKFIYDYIDLEKIRHDTETQIKFQFTGNAEGHFIEPLLLIPFVENSFKHGINSALGKGWVEMDLKLHDKALSLVVKNSMESAKQKTEIKKGIGLENVRKRLELLYPGKHSLNITSTENEFLISLMININ